MNKIFRMFMLNEVIKKKGVNMNVSFGALNVTYQKNRLAHKKNCLKKLIN